MAGLVGRRRDRIAVACALVVPVAVCTALVPFRASVPNTDAALLLVAFVVAVAAFGNRFAGCLASLGAAAWFDFFLTAPYERFAITHRTDVETTVLLLAVGVAVTEIAVAARRRRARVVTDDALLSVVESTSGLVARGEPAGTVVDQVRSNSRPCSAVTSACFTRVLPRCAGCGWSRTVRCGGAPRCGISTSTVSRKSGCWLPRGTAAWCTGCSPSLPSRAPRLAPRLGASR